MVPIFLVTFSPIPSKWNISAVKFLEAMRKIQTFFSYQNFRKFEKKKKKKKKTEQDALRGNCTPNQI